MLSGIESSYEDIERISLEPTDIGYRADYHEFIVLLDGERVPFIRTADKRTGEVFCTQTDEKGYPLTDGDEFVICRKIGCVEIVRLGQLTKILPGPYIKNKK
jgi:hypothetical protein